MARLAESLAGRGAEVEILSLNPRKHRVAPAGPLPVTAVDIDTGRLVAPLLHAWRRRIPWIVARFVSGELAGELDRALRRIRPDVVQIESPFLLPYAAQVRLSSDAAVVLRSLNVEFRIWEGLAATQRGLFRRVTARAIAASLRRYELQEMEALDGIVPISDDDARDFRALGTTSPMQVVPCSVTLPPLPARRPEPRPVGFIGSLDFRPNQQAVEWILGELWPRVLQRIPDAQLSIAGSSAPAWLRRLAATSGVELRSDVPDADTFLAGLSVFIAPLFAGGGMRIKVLEAMALGIPIVATPLGAGGIDARHGEELLLASDAEAFAGAVTGLLRDPAAAQRLGAAARARVAARYDAGAIAETLLAFYVSLREEAASRRLRLDCHRSNADNAR